MAFPLGFKNSLTNSKALSENSYHLTIVLSFEVVRDTFHFKNSSAKNLN